MELCESGAPVQMVEPWSFDTLKVMAGHDPACHNHSFAVPIYQITAFELGDVARTRCFVSLDEQSFPYSHVSSPTTDVLKKRIAALDGAPAAVSISSGMVVIAHSLLNTAEGEGRIIGQFKAYLALLGIGTLSERVRKQVETTERIVRYLEQHEKVSWVKYPYANNSPYRALAAKYLPKGAGSVFTFGFKGTVEQSERFIDSTELFSYQANIDDVRSLIINVSNTTHRELMESEQRRADIAPGTIRLSIGFEDQADLIADLEQAFAKAENACCI
jgi:O-acetylhomoserine/O-acetylserine sulfhydrylase-like pyridoxal-dependent enzyme